jgi:hypothetical protein
MPGAVSAEVSRFAGLIDAETNRIAAVLEGLKAALVDASSPAEVASILDPVITRLKAVAADPANPVPTA